MRRPAVIAAAAQTAPPLAEALAQLLDASCWSSCGPLAEADALGAPDS